MYCLIVRRGDLTTYDTLYKTFGEKTPVIWERRHAERRKAASDVASAERRLGERRGVPPPSWKALGFVVVERGGSVKTRGPLYQAQPAPRAGAEWS
jgi:hypothetical protein